MNKTEGCTFCGSNDQQRIETAADNCEVLRARLAKYEDADGNPKAQPCGVVLPERKTWNQVTGREGFIETETHNACLDEVARLNSSPVSAGATVKNCLTVGGVDERAAFEAWRLEKFCGGTERLKKCSNAPDVYYYTAEQEAWKVWQARAALSAPSHGEQVRELPECVRAWFEAKKQHVKAVGDYNARLAFVKQHMPLGTSVDPEYQIMETADRKVRDLVWPMFVGLMEIDAPSAGDHKEKSHD